MNTRTMSTLVAAAFLVGLATPAGAQEARRLFESGKFQEVVERTAGDSSPDAQFMKALAHRRLNQNDEAKGAYQRLQGAGGAWKAVGDSGTALVDGNLDAALDAAKRATEQDGGLAPAWYQLGLVQDAKGDAGAAAEAFERAAQADPQMAYAHYNAGMNFYKAKRIDKMAVYFEHFLKLAPDAPEKPAVESLMRTVRGR
jgi:tetratricopeptide (TPR) repeat protein